MGTWQQTLNYLALLYVLGLIICCLWKGFAEGWDGELFEFGGLYLIIGGIGILVLDMLVQLGRSLSGQESNKPG